MPGYKKRCLTTRRLESQLPRWIEDLRSGTTPEIDLTEYEDLDLGALALLLAFSSSARGGWFEGGSCGPLDLLLPEDPDARAFLGTSGFFSLAKTDDLFKKLDYLSSLYPTQEGRQRDPWSFPRMEFRRLVEPSAPLFATKESFQEECGKFVSYLQDTYRDALTSHLGYPVHIADEFWRPNKEVFENIHLHSRSWGFGAIQGRRDSVVMAYSDLGIGVRGSLSKVGSSMAEAEGKRWNDDTAVELAFRDGFTSLPGVSQGYGLYRTRKFVRDRGGELEFRSGMAKLVFTNKQKQSIIRVVELPGVSVRIELPRYEPA